MPHTGMAEDKLADFILQLKKARDLGTGQKSNLRLAISSVCGKNESVQSFVSSFPRLQDDQNPMNSECSNFCVLNSELT